MFFRKEIRASRQFTVFVVLVINMYMREFSENEQEYQIVYVGTSGARLEQVIQRGEK